MSTLECFKKSSILIFAWRLRSAAREENNWRSVPHPLDSGEEAREGWAGGGGRVLFISFPVYHRYVYHEPFIELSLALTIWL